MNKRKVTGCIAFDNKSKFIYSTSKYKLFCRCLINTAKLFPKADGDFVGEWNIMA